MQPTLFTLPFLPDWLADIKSYGVMMCIAFLTGIWLACRRAFRSRANPDIILNAGFIALICGVAGARAMFVMHYWDTRFANQPNPFFAVFDIRAGGLEFWGGPLLGIPMILVYLKFFAKVSIRWYFDILIPSLAWGLAITRVGCFLNGCCWGSVCVTDAEPHLQEAAVPWAVSFPYGSPAMNQQYKFGQLTLPKELIYTLETGESMPFPRDFIQFALKDNGETRRKIEALKKAKGEKAVDQVLRFRRGKIAQVERQCALFGLTAQQLADLSALYTSKPVHPSQLYAVVNAFLISWLLSVMFYYRKRHGVVFGWFLILYSISRVFLESIRQDNPLDIGGITISQAISTLTFLIGVVWLAAMYRLPMTSPRAVAYEEPEEEDARSKPAKGKKK